MSVNKVILVGNVGKDPETRYFEGGTAVCKFPLATSEVYKNREGEKVTTTEWHNIVLWRGLAEVAEKYVKKGAQLYIEGRIKTRSYNDQDGKTRYITEIVGDTMQMLGKRSGEPHNASDNQEHASSRSEERPETSGTQGNDENAVDFSLPSDTDDLPF